MKSRALIKFRIAPAVPSACIYINSLLILFGNWCIMNSKCQSTINVSRMYISNINTYDKTIYELFIRIPLQICAKLCAMHSTVWVNKYWPCLLMFETVELLRCKLYKHPWKAQCRPTGNWINFRNSIVSMEFGECVYIAFCSDCALVTCQPQLVIWNSNEIAYSEHYRYYNIVWAYIIHEHDEYSKIKCDRINNTYMQSSQYDNAEFNTYPYIIKYCCFMYVIHFSIFDHNMLCRWLRPTASISTCIFDILIFQYISGSGHIWMQPMLNTKQQISNGAKLNQVHRNDRHVLQAHRHVQAHINNALAKRLYLHNSSLQRQKHTDIFWTMMCILSSLSIINPLGIRQYFVIFFQYILLRREYKTFSEYWYFQGFAG